MRSCRAGQDAGGEEVQLIVVDVAEDDRRVDKGFLDALAPGMGDAEAVELAGLGFEPVAPRCASFGSSRARQRAHLLFTVPSDTPSSLEASETE